MKFSDKINGDKNLRERIGKNTTHPQHMNNIFLKSFCLFINVNVNNMAKSINWSCKP